MSCSHQLYKWVDFAVVANEAVYPASVAVIGKALPRLRSHIVKPGLAGLIALFVLLGTTDAGVFPPGEVTAVATSCSTTTLTWVDNAKNESGFRVERSLSPTSGFSVIATLDASMTSLTDTGLSPVTTYYYRVIAFTPQHDSPYSSVASATKWPDTTPPTVSLTSIILNTITNHASSLDGLVVSNTITLSATASDNIGVTSVEFYLDGNRISLDGTQAYLATLDTINSVNGSHDVYAVAADAAGNRQTSPSITLVFSNPPPAMPGNLDATTVSFSQIDLDWQDNSGNESSFKLERSTSSTFSSYATIMIGANTTSYSDTGLSPDTTYFYRVKSCSVNWGDSAYTAIASATTPPTIPVAPSGLTATATSSSQTILSWMDNSYNETGFNVERAASSAGPWTHLTTTGAGVTSFLVTGLNASTTYYYRVNATNSGGTSGFSSIADATTLPTIPVAPSGLTATATSSSQTILSWVDNSNNEDGFNVQRAISSAGPWSRLTNMSAGVTSFLVTGLGSATTYYYRINATNEGGSSAYSAIASATTLPTIPVAPSGLTATATSSSQTILSWVDNSNNEDGFNVQRAISSAGPWSRLTNVSAGVTSFLVTGLGSATTYYYRINATNEGGSSAYSIIASATTLPTGPAAPSGLTATATSSSQTILSWIDNSNNEDGFNVQRAISSAGPWSRLTNVSAGVTSFLVTGLGSATTYFYRINATNEGGSSAYSIIASATTLPTGPAAPSGLMATATSTSQTILNWIDNSSNETGFNVERATSSAGPWTRLITTSAGVTFYLVTGLSSSTTYYYRINAAGAGGASAYSVIASATTLGPLTIAPNAPSGLSASRISSSQMSVGWTDNSTNETSFVIQRSGSYGGPWSQIAALGAGATSYSDGNLQASTFYCYRACSSNSAGSSAWSNIAGDTTMDAPTTPLPSAPGNLVATAASSNQINLTWSDNSANEATFKIERALSSGGPFAQISTTGAGVTSYGDLGLTASTVYYYRVRASNSTGDSGYSSQAAATTLAAGTAPPPPVYTNNFTIPSTHPKLWWNTARLAQAQAWYSTHPFTPSSSDPFGCAFRYVMTGESSYARTAIDWLMNYTIPQAQLDGIASDNARWDGENAIVVYDWCYSQMTATERATIISRWNGYLDALRNKTWGGVGMEMSNYYWGYLRNELEWGIATYGENTMASSFLDTALTTRWQNSFMPFASGDGKGGVLQEGPGYGAVTAWYPIIPFTTVSFLGRNLWSESQFFKEMIFYIIHATTPAPTARKDDSAITYELFPFNDSEYPQNGSIFSARKYYGDAMSVLANQWGTLAVGQYARRWLNRVGPSISSHVAALDAGGTDRDFSNLPLDYYASGPQHLFARNNWGPGSVASSTTALHLLLGRPKAVGHSHRDAGSFQIWRNGRWLSRNTSGYADSIIGFNGSSVDVSQPEACNALLFNGIGQLPDSWCAGDATVVRLEVKPAYVYVAVDLTQLYRANADFAGRVPEAPISSYVRELVFVRATETLYVCDRIDAGTGNVTASFLLHSEQTAPLFTTTSMVGTPVATRTVSEGSSAWAQTRFEYDYSVNGKGYLVRKISPAGVNDGNSVQFNATLGGTFNGTPFSSGVQTMSVTDNGPVW